MIYRIVVAGGTENTDIYGNTRSSAILDPQLDIELNSAGTLSFTIPPDNPAFALMQVFKTEIEVYEDEDIIWFGRVLSIEKDWNNQYKITCEGGLAYFNDSLQRPNEYKINTTTTRSFFAALIANHNAQVEEKFQWEVGEYTSMENVGVEDIPIWRQTDYEYTLECLQQMCLDTQGGYLIVRKVYDDPNDISTMHRYIDWVKVLPWNADQPVQFGLNLLDISRDTNGADVCTVVIPVGSDDLMLTKYKAVADEDHPDEYGCYHILNADEVVHAAGVERFGRVVQKKNFNDIDADTASQRKDNLYKAAAEWLERQNKDDITTIECSAAELHYLYGDRFGKFQVGQKVTVSSPAHGIEEQVFPMYKISVSLNSGAKKITIGTPPKKELTDIIKSGSSTSTRTTNNSSSGGGSGGGGGTVLVKDVKVKFPGDEDFKSSVRSKVSRIDMSGLVADVLAGNQSVKNENGEAILPLYDVELDGTSIVTDGVAALTTDTIVKGNPLQQVDSGDLRKIKIGNHVFSIPEGGGGSGGDSEFIIEEICSTVTEVNEHNAGKRTDTTHTIPYSGSVTYPNVPHLVYTGKTKAQLTDYDAFVLLLDFGISDLSSNPRNYESFLIFKDTITDMAWEQRTSAGRAQWDNTYSGPYYDFGYFVWSTFDHSTDVYQLAFCATRDNASGYVNIGAVYGIKFGGGGGGVKDILVDGVSVVDPDTKLAEFDSSEFGTPVEANPSETATDDLTTIKIGDTVYDIPGGSGSGGQQYTCVLLFENDPLPSPTSGTSSASRSYELSNSIDDYDAVWVILITIHKTQSEIGNPISMLILKQDYYTINRYFGNGYTGATRLINVGFTDNTHVVTEAYRSESGNEPILYKVYGLKFAATTINRPVYLSDYYDTEERVVGRWTDGKPLYQKTYDFGTDVEIGNSRGVDLSSYVSNYMEYEQIIYCLGYGTYNGRYADPLYLTTTLNNEVMAWCAEGMTVRGITVQYTKTADAPGTGPTPGNIMYLPAMYSEEEREVGVWIDGKPLYQKTFDLSSDVSIGSNSWYDTGIAVQYLERCINIFAGQRGDRLTNETNNAWGALGAFYNTSTNSIRILNCRPAAIILRYFTMQYTKTTDQPGGGTWTPDGQLAHHYSKSEHIIGTWIDGSTLYERTFDFGSDVSLTANNWYDTSISNSGISLLTNVEAISANGNFRGQIEGSANPSGSYIQLRSDGIASSVRYVTLRYTKTT